MLYKASFGAYSFLLLLYSIYTGLNHYRIQDKGKIHPQVVTTLFPFMVNVGLPVASLSWPNWCSPE